MDAAMSAAVSGLQAQSAALATVSTNLANSQTTGYKAVSTVFNSLLTEESTGFSFPAGGVQAVARQNVMAQGLVQTTTNSTDMAINGNGLFPVTNGANGATTYYTRDGAFGADQNGNLTLAGTNYYLKGWPTDSTGAVTAANQSESSSLQTVNINSFSSSAVATTNYQLQANLPAEAQSSVYAQSYTNTGASPPVSGSVSYAYSLVSNNTTTSPPTTTYQLSVSDSNSTANSSVTLSDGGNTSTPGQPLVYNVTVDNTGAITSVVYAATGAATSSSPALPSVTPSDSGGSALNAPASWAALGTPFSQTTTMSVYDSLGDQQDVPVTWTAEGSNNWLMTVNTPTDAAGSPSGQLLDSNGNPVSSYSYNVSFDTSGNLSAITPLPTFPTDGSSAITSPTPTAPTLPNPTSGVTQPIISANWATPASTTGSNVVNASNGGSGQVFLNLGTIGQTNGLSQFDSGESSPQVDVKNITQNGVQAGQLTGVSIASNGNVIAAYNNGQNVPIYKIPVATFPNEDGLSAMNDGVYGQSQLSGSYILNPAGTNGAGAIEGSSLEASTVDTSTQFANMITAQQAYSSSSQVIGVDKQNFQSLIQTIGA